jgi:hypothetical protein
VINQRDTPKHSFEVKSPIFRGWLLSFDIVKTQLAIKLLEHPPKILYPSFFSLYFCCKWVNWEVIFCSKIENSAFVGAKFLFGSSFEIILAIFAALNHT